MKLVHYIIVVLISICGTSFAQSADEYATKTALMVKMTHFIQWPDEPKTITASSKFTICHDTSPEKLSSLLEWSLEGRIKDKEVSLLSIQADNNDLSQCHILYVTNSTHLAHYVTSANRHQFLTFSDQPGNAKRGIIINFFKHQNKLRFEINLQKARKNGFKIHPKLLNLAEIISAQEGVE